jgi:hypothetical protein
LQGALGHAKNGDEVFWEEKFHAANGKAQACTQGALLFFLLCFGVGGEGGGEIFFHFSWLPNVFALCSFEVPNGFPIFSPTFSSSLLFHMPWKMVSSFHLYRETPSGEGGNGPIIIHWIN